MSQEERTRTFERRLRRPNKRHIYLRDYLSGKSYKEIAKTWGVSPGEVAHLINRGVRHMGEYGLPQNVLQAARVLRELETPRENILEILAILMSHPNSNVLNVIFSVRHQRKKSV